MKESLQVGIESEMSHDVTEDMSPPHLPVKVLSTPAMIQMIEGTCLVSVQEHLDDSETTVGTHVCVSHVGKASPGEQITIKARLKNIQKRRLTFDTEVHAPSGVISTGTHERAVIDLNRMAGKS
jgi:predicted thioesterase